MISNDTLAWVDTESGTVTSKAFVTGVSGRVLGIDVRPSDGKLYGLFEDGTVATIDPQTGGRDPARDAEDGSRRGHACHGRLQSGRRRDAHHGLGRHQPAHQDRRRRGGRGQAACLRQQTTCTPSETPAIIAGAYTNSYKGTEKTALYNIDGTIAGLIRQDPPNDGTLKAVGKLGVALEKSVGFDILSDGNGGNEAWLMNGATLYSVDLETGKATSVGTISDIGGAVRDIAILPAS